MIWLLGLACAVMAVAVPGAVLLACALLAPGLVMLIVEREPARPEARALLLCGLSPTLLSLGELADRGFAMQTLGDVLFQRGMLGVAWVAAGAGWVLMQALSLLLRLALDGAARRSLARMRQALQRDADSWDLESPEIVLTPPGTPDGR